MNEILPAIQKSLEPCCFSKTEIKGHKISKISMITITQLKTQLRKLCTYKNMKKSACSFLQVSFLFSDFYCIKISWIYSEYMMNI